MNERIELILKISIRIVFALVALAVITSAIKGEMPHADEFVSLTASLKGLATLAPSSILYLACVVIILSPFFVIVYMGTHYLFQKDYRFFIINLLIAGALVAAAVLKTH